MQYLHKTGLLHSNCIFLYVIQFFNANYDIQWNFFHVGGKINPRWAPIVYRLIGAALIGIFSIILLNLKFKF